MHFFNIYEEILCTHSAKDMHKIIITHSSINMRKNNKYYSTLICTKSNRLINNHKKWIKQEMLKNINVIPINNYWYK